jgi:hypothetical protein
VLAATNPPSAGRIVKCQACCFVLAVVLGESVRIARDVQCRENIQIPGQQTLSAVHVGHLAGLLRLHISFPAAQRKDTSLDATQSLKKRGLTNEERLD